MVDFIIPVPDLPPLRFGGATRKLRKDGRWYIQASVKCEMFRPIDDVLEFLASKTNVENWLVDDSVWTGEEWTWNLMAIVERMNDGKKSQGTPARRQDISFFG